MCVCCVCVLCVCVYFAPLSRKVILNQTGKSCPGAPRSGRWRTRTREAARPHAHAPARPRSRVVRARTWVRAPPRVLPDASLNRARAPRVPATKCGPDPFFFSSADRRLVTATVSARAVESASAASEGARQKTHRPSAVACSDRDSE